MVIFFFFFSFGISVCYKPGSTSLDLKVHQFQEHWTQATLASQTDPPPTWSNILTFRHLLDGIRANVLSLPTELIPSYSSFQKMKSSRCAGMFPYIQHGASPLVDNAYVELQTDVSKNCDWCQYQCAGCMKLNRQGQKECTHAKGEDGGAEDGGADDGKSASGSSPIVERLDVTPETSEKDNTADDEN